MAILTPVVGLFSSEVDIEIGTGLVDAVSGDVLLYSDIVAALDAAGYGWTATRARYAATYATDRDAESAFLWANGNGTLLKDRILINDTGPAPWNYAIYACANIEVVRQTQRAATIRLQNPRFVDGVPTTVHPRSNVAYIGAALSAQCELKAILTDVYPTIESLVEGFGNQRITWLTGFGNAPNYQPAFDSYIDGSIRARIELQTYSGSRGYSYLTIDMGWSGAR